MNIRKIHKFFTAGLFAVCFLLSASSMHAQEQVVPDIKAQESADNQNESEEILVTLDFKDTEIISVLSGISQSYNLNIIAGKNIQGKVTVNFNDVPLEEALTAILDINGYKFVRKGNIIYILKKEDDITSEYFPLKYSKASSAKELLSSMLSEKGSIKVDSLNNSLVVTDTIEKVLSIKEFINEIDIVPTQVMIEAKIVDVTLKDLQNLGVSWSGIYQADKLFSSREETYDGGSGNDQSITSTLTMAGPSSALSGGQLTLATLLAGGRSINVTLDALVQDQKARILATPSVVTLNNQEARIIIGEKVPYKEKTQTTTGTTETTKYIDVGTTLRVTPQVNDDNTITMTIHPEVSSVSALLDAGPRITTREADVTVMVHNNETIVIGGLLKEEDTIVRNKIPILGDIPLLGLLFSSKSVNKEQKELVVFITPKIITFASEIIKEEKTEEKVLVDDLAQRLFVDRILDRADNLTGNKDLESSEKTKLTRLNEAVFLYDQIINVYPDSPLAAEVLFKGARVDRILGNDEKYEAKLDMLINNYPNSKYTAHSLAQLKSIERKRKIKTDKQAKIDKVEFERIQDEKEQKQKEEELNRLKEQRIKEAEQLKKQREIEREKLIEQKRMEKEQRIKEAEELKVRREEE
ncbi:MAG: secretin and TonB N-terminal domain-containing protein, partial [Candidatus Gygaella obscura]|nr:secretin and TonB N-terminal domain-containing protein [Candidatus Gygaella obscura]